MLLTWELRGRVSWLWFAVVVLHFPEKLGAAEPVDPAAETASPPAAAEASADETSFDLSIEALKGLRVVGASKREQTLAQAPASVSVVTADQIARFGYRTLAEILASAPGYHASYDRAYSFLGVRGFNRGDYNSRVLLLVDGHRVNNNLSDGGYLGTEFILDTDLIDTVEIIRGPGAVLYGNNAFFGVVNVRTRRGRDAEGMGGETSFAAGSFDTFEGRATYGHQWENGLELLLSGTLYDSAGPGDLDFINVDPTDSRARNFTATDCNDENHQKVFGSLTWNDLILSGAFMAREKGDPTAPDTSEYGDPRNRAYDHRGYADLRYAHEFAGLFDVTARAYYDRTDFTFDRFYATPVPAVNKEVRAGEWAGTEVQFDRAFWDERVQLTLGGEYRNEFTQRRQNYDDLPDSPLYADVSADTDNRGVFAQADWGMVDSLHLVAGGRYDQYGDFDPSANPRVALIYNPWTDTTLKAIYGTAFRVPNFLEQAYANPAALPEPEEITTYEVVGEQRINDIFRATLSLYYNDIENLITVPRGDYTRNLEGATAMGIEAAIDGTWENGLRARLGYAYQQTEDRETDEVLTDSPAHLVDAAVSVPLFRQRLYASTELQYTSARDTLWGTEADDFFTVNLVLYGRDVVRGLEASVGVYNLFDADYADPAGSVPYHVQDVIPQDGITFRAKLTYRF